MFQEGSFNKGPPPLPSWRKVKLQNPHGQCPFQGEVGQQQKSKDSAPQWKWAAPLSTLEPEDSTMGPSVVSQQSKMPCTEHAQDNRTLTRLWHCGKPRHNATMSDRADRKSGTKHASANKGLCWYLFLEYLFSHLDTSWSHLGGGSLSGGTASLHQADKEGKSVEHFPDL